jgi:putative ABC transport system permease protein
MGESDVAVAVITGMRREFQFLHGSRRELMRRFNDETCVFVSESFARRHRLRENDAIELMTPDGPQSFSVAAIFYDYTRDQGVVYMSARNFARYWHDDRINSVALYLRKDHRAEDVTEAFRAQFSQSGEFVIFSNQSLRRRVLDFRSNVRGHARSLAISLFVMITDFPALTIRSRSAAGTAILRAIGASAAQIRRLLLSKRRCRALAAAVGLVAASACRLFDRVINGCFRLDDLSGVSMGTFRPLDSRAAILLRPRYALVG